MSEPNIQDPGHPPEQIPTSEWHRVQQSDEFAHLTKTFRGFAFPMAVAFFVWYALYVGFSTMAQEFMSAKVFGNITVGFIFGILQFVSTFLITWLYIRHMNRKVDPLATKLREELEGSAQ